MILEHVILTEPTHLVRYLTAGRNYIVYIVVNLFNIACLRPEFLFVERDAVENKSGKELKMLVYFVQQTEISSLFITNYEDTTGESSTKVIQFVYKIMYFFGSSVLTSYIRRLIILLLRNFTRWIAT